MTLLSILEEEEMHETYKKEMTVHVHGGATCTFEIKLGSTIGELKNLLTKRGVNNNYCLLWGGRKLGDEERLTGNPGHDSILFLVWKCEVVNADPLDTDPEPVEEEATDEEEEETEEEEEPNPWNEAKLLYVLSPLILLLFAFMVQMMIGGTPMFDIPSNIPTVNVTLCSIHGCATVTPAPTMGLGHTVLP
jgi:hypothetical protein